jgi:hypothetical protein
MMNMAKVFKVGVVSVLLATGSANAATELIINGSFENLGFGHSLPDHQADVYSVIDGWFSLTHGIEVQNNVLGAGSDGHNVVELDTNQNSSMSQLVLGTKKNQSYTLSFDLLDRAGVDAASQGIQVLWDGKVVGTYGAGYSAWTMKTLTVTGSKFGADLLTFRAMGSSDTLGTTLDNVSLISAVPEPENYGMLLAGLGMVGFMARRRKGAK